MTLFALPGPREKRKGSFPCTMPSSTRYSPARGRADRYSAIRRERSSRSSPWRSASCASSSTSSSATLNLHAWRHTFESYVTMRTGNIRLVQKLLGHKSIRKTEIYLHLSDNHFHGVVGQLSAPKWAEFGRTCLLDEERDIETK